MRTADMMAVGGVEAKRASEAFKSRTRAGWQNDRGRMLSGVGSQTQIDAHIKPCSAPRLKPSPRLRLRPALTSHSLNHPRSLCCSPPRSRDTNMSDHEAGGMSSDEDLSLPKATVTKMIAGTSTASMPLVPVVVDLTALPPRAELLPNDITCAKETRDLIIECCVGEVAVRSSRVIADLLTRLSRRLDRVHTPNILRGERDMRAGVKEDDRARTHNLGTQGMLHP